MGRGSGIGRVLAGAVAACAVASAAQAASEVALPGDEPVIVTPHQIKTSRGVLSYEARTGRIPIRNEETGEVRGHIFFVARQPRSLAVLPSRQRLP